MAGIEATAEAAAASRCQHVLRGDEHNDGALRQEHNPIAVDNRRTAGQRLTGKEVFRRRHRHRLNQESTSYTILQNVVDVLYVQYVLSGT